MEREIFLPRNYALVLFGALARNCLLTNTSLEGLCPERVFLNDEWFSESVETMVEPSYGPHTAYAYFSPEYLRGHDWDDASSVFAIFAITYKFLTGELPYLGNVPDALFACEGGRFYIEKIREASALNVQKIPTVFQGFMAKGLMLSAENRYQTIGDTADDYHELAEKFRVDDNQDNEYFNDTYHIERSEVYDLSIAKEAFCHKAPYRIIYNLKPKSL